MLFVAFSVPPPPPLSRCFWAPGFTGEPSSAQSSSHALSAAAFVDSLVFRVGSSLATGAFVPGDEIGSLSVGRAEPSSRRGFRFGSPAPNLHLFSDASRSGWSARLLDRSRVRGVFEA